MGRVAKHRSGSSCQAQQWVELPSTAEIKQGGNITTLLLIFVMQACHEVLGDTWPVGSLSSGSTRERRFYAGRRSTFHPSSPTLGRWPTAAPLTWATWPVVSAKGWPPSGCCWLASSGKYGSTCRIKRKRFSTRQRRTKWRFEAASRGA